jgi:carbonic anhydrase
MPDLSHLFENNRRWADEVERKNPGFFDRLAAQQSPKLLWIGCADSRVPANEITGLAPGEVFVHRNVANVVAPSDLNALSVVQYAVEVLKVEDIVVCGHYGCGGVRAALDEARLGLIDNWLLHVKDVRWRHRDLIDSISEDRERFEKLCELNVIEQVRSLASTTIIRQAWQEGRRPAVHGWVYSLHDGHLRDLGVSAASGDDLARRYADVLG